MRRTYSILLVLLVCLFGLAPAAAAQQVDLTGFWSVGIGNHEERPIRGDPGVESGEYVGIPLNDAARQHADSWTPAMHSLSEWQGRPHPVTYSMRAPGPNMRIAPVIDPDTQQMIAYTLQGLFGNAERIIWLDGRPHPSKYAEHLWQGFSTGEWLPDGTFKVVTTHIKYSFVHRNGIPLSPYTVFTEYYMRHGDLLTGVLILDDPIYLTEPMIRTSTWVLNPTQGFGTSRPFEVFDEIPSLSRGVVPSMPLGYIDTEYAEANHLPVEAARGGAQTMYPEYATRLKQLMADMAAAGQ